MINKVLLIEDDQWLADSYQAILRSRGHDVTHLATAHESMEWIDENQPALIVADVLLGDHSSFTLFHELQSYSDTSLIPIVLCTNVDAEQLKDVSLSSYGIVEVLDKATLTPDRLVLAVEEHLPEGRGVEL